MPSIPLHTTPLVPHSAPQQNPLPQLLHTPSGLALLEIQGTINMPTTQALLETETENTMETDLPTSHETPIGRIVFPDMLTEDDKKDPIKSKRVYLYVGKHQRLTGEVKKLVTPLGIIRRRDTSLREKNGDWDGEELEIVDIVRWKILFSTRPEPVSST